MDTNDLKVVVQSEKLDTPHIILTEYGVEFDPETNPSIEEWHRAVLGVQKAHGMTQFYLGDLMAFAESDVTGWGQSKYDKLVEATGYEYGYLRQLAALSRRFSPEFRKNVFVQTNKSGNVTHSHFSLVAPLDDERAFHFLTQVAEGRWTVAKLREEVAKSKGVIRKPAKEEPEYSAPTFAQRVKDAFTRVRDTLREEEGDLIRIQVVKDGRVISEELVEVEES